MTVSINPPKTPITAGSQGTAIATVPNVCKMPGPPAPFVPTPLPNVARSGTKPKGYSKQVKIEGKRVAIRGASFSSTGDIASKATGGGVVSATTHGPIKFVGPGSMNVKIEGQNVQLLGDPVLNNCAPGGGPANAATMVGVLQKPGMAAVFGDEACPLCGQAHGEAGQLAETGASQAGVEDVEAAIETALAEANANVAARLAEIKAELAALELQKVGLTRKQRKPLNLASQDLQRERRGLAVELSAMMGAVECECHQIYAGTSFVQYRDVVERYGHHAPTPEFTLRRQPDKNEFEPDRFEAFQAVLAEDKRDAFEKAWQDLDKQAVESRAGRTDEMAYPPGNCAAQVLLVLTLSHSCRPLGLTERWYSSRGSTLEKLKVRDLSPEGTPSAPRFATDEELSGDHPIPPCATCQVILQALMCTDDNTRCSHQSATKVCYRC